MERTFEYPSETHASFDDVCAEIRTLLRDVPREQWVWTCNEGEPTTLAAIVGEHLGKSDRKELWGVALADDALREHGEARTVCFTGNGPNSRRHARLLMLVRAVLPELLDRAAGPCSRPSRSGRHG